MSRRLPPSFPFILAGSLLTRLPLAPLCQQVSQTPVLSQTKIQASLLEESVTSGTEWPLTGRRWSLFCVVLGQLGESHESVSAEGNWSPTFQVFPAFQRSLAHGRLDGGMLRGLSQPRLLRESPGSWSWQHLEGPKQRPKATVLSFCPSIRWFPGADTSTTEETTAESMARCQRGSTGKQAFRGSEAEVLGSRDSGQQAHAPVMGSRSGRTWQPAVPWWRLPGSCRGW